MEDNPMRQIRIGKVTLNVGAGKDQKVLEKALRLLKNLTGIEPVKTKTTKRLQAWGLRPGLPVGTKITLRGKAAEDMIPRLLSAKDDMLDESCFDDYGNISFGIPEYVDIKDAKYDTEIGMMGLQASITLTRPGFRVKKRRLKSRRLPIHHEVSQEEGIEFMEQKYGLKTGEEE